MKNANLFLCSGAIISLLLLLTACKSNEPIEEPIEGGGDDKNKTTAVELPSPQLEVVSVTDSTLLITWESDSRVEKWLYTVNSSESSILPQQGNSVVTPKLELTDLKEMSTYKISVCAIPKNTVLYSRSPWATIEVCTLAETIEQPNPPKDPEDPEDPEPEEPFDPGNEVTLNIENISGSWKIHEWPYSENNPSINPEIYICFTKEGLFELYQKNVNYMGVIVYTGEYYLNESERIISGRYDDGVEWAGNYRVESLYENMFTWDNGEGLSTYVRIEDIPDEIRDLAQPANETRATHRGIL